MFIGRLHNIVGNYYIDLYIRKGNIYFSEGRVKKYWCSKTKLYEKLVPAYIDNPSWEWVPVDDFDGNC